jgi:hypothetical protein
MLRIALVHIETKRKEKSVKLGLEEGEEEKEEDVRPKLSLQRNLHLDAMMRA